MQGKNKIFALDIGTRSVVGVILEPAEKGYHVIDMVMKEHENRSMLDGQIHDVLSVSTIIKEIKKELESRHGQLKKVCVAAAGRALRTETASASIYIKGKPIISKEDILHLELMAVQAAQEKAAVKEKPDKNYQYYCVGYSVLYYRLDEEEIGSLIDQQGEKAAVEIIATFLPRVVVESLIAALHRAELEMDALTLEPIAAIQVLIPASMRHLNLALVDIGAGTSDIALTDSGTVIAYGMVPVAGDEITETLSDQFLLDFSVAETVKRQLHTGTSVKLTDILGVEHELPSSEIIQQIDSAIDRLTDAIAEEVLKLNNQQPPKAVMLVGGGSLTPQLPERLATKLELPLNRVAIRGTEAIQGLRIHEEIEHAPTLVTPIGIAIASTQNPIQYKSVMVNDQFVHLFELKDLTVGDCLLATDLKMEQLYGKPGKSITITYNGQTLTIPGEYGEAPLIRKNGEECEVNDLVKDGDKIVIEKGADGKPASIQLNDLLDQELEITVTLNKESVTSSLSVFNNGKRADLTEPLKDGDQIEVMTPTVEELLQSNHEHSILKSLQPFFITINNKKTFFPSFSGRLLINEREAKLKQRLQHGDHIVSLPSTEVTLRDIAEIKQWVLEHFLIVTFNGEKLLLTKRSGQILRNEEVLSLDDPIYLGDELVFTAEKVTPFIFQDILKHVEIPVPEQANNGKFTLLKNGKETNFFVPLQPGDHLEIKWEMKSQGIQ